MRSCVVISLILAISPLGAAPAVRAQRTVAPATAAGPASPEAGAPPMLIWAPQQELAPQPQTPAAPAEQPAPPASAPAPAPVAAAPPAVTAASAPSRYLLMRELQGSYYGTFLDTNRMSISGWIDTSFTASTADDSNLPMGYNDQANKFEAQQIWVRFDRPVVTTGTTEPTFGGRIDMNFGTDYRFTLPQRGLLYSQRFENNGTFYLYGFDPIQFYTEAYFPTVAQGLDVKAGRFYTIYGVESPESISTPLVSHSYLFTYDPTTNTGILGTLTLDPVWTVQAGLAVGSDLFISDADVPTFTGSVQWTQPGGRNIVKAATILGPGDFNEHLNVNNPNIVDVVWTHLFDSTPNALATVHPEWAMPIPPSRLSYQLETLFGWQYSMPDIGTATWWGLAQYLNYQFTPRLAGTGRFDLFYDGQGQRTGFTGLYISPAVGLTFKPLPGIILRPELRYDYNEESRPFEDHHGLATATADMIVRW